MPGSETNDFISSNEWVNPDHMLRRPLEKALDGIGVDEFGVVVEEVLKTLDEYRIISYGAPDALKLFTPQGRALMLLMEDPDLTVRELAVLLGITEGNATVAISALVKANLVVRTKVGGRNRYNFAPEGLCNHPDVSRFLAAITPVISEEPPDISL
jgi:hypothetical protein